MNSRDSDDSRVPKTPDPSKKSAGGASRREHRTKKRGPSTDSNSASSSSKTTTRETTAGSRNERAGLWGRIGRPKEWGWTEWGVVSGSILGVVGILVGVVSLSSSAVDSPPPPPKPPDIKICEVIADPPYGIEPDDEEIVLCNYEIEAVTLGGWTLQDNHGQYLIPVGEVIEPQSKWRVAGPAGRASSGQSGRYRTGF